MTRRPPLQRTAKRAPGRRRTRTRRRPGVAPPPRAEVGPEPDHGLGREAGPGRARVAYALDISARQAYVRVDTAFVRKVMRTVLAAERVAAAQISVALADDATVRRVNRDFLGHDYDTDVLSFLFESSAMTPSRQPKKPGVSERVPEPRGAGRRIDGEVLVSAEMAVEMADRFGWSARDELTLYLVHGLLHLCGYDDLSPAERRLMRQREREILAQLKIVARPRSGRGQRPLTAAKGGARSAKNGSPS
jgi:probable rRNA maturation factor